MTREEYIDFANSLKNNYTIDFDKLPEFCDMAISALSAEPCREADDYENEIADLHTRLDIAEYDKERYKEEITTLEAENKGEWIPVSERLPEKFRFVNCTCHSLIDDREDWVVETVYVPQPPNSPYSDWGNIPMLNDKECEVTAWVYREIPEPYKSERGE